MVVFELTSLHAANMQNSEPTKPEHRQWTGDAGVSVLQRQVKVGRGFKNTAGSMQDCGDEEKRKIRENGVKFNHKKCSDLEKDDEDCNSFADDGGTYCQAKHVCCVCTDNCPQQSSADSISSSGGGSDSGSSSGSAYDSHDDQTPGGTPAGSVYDSQADQTPGGTPGCDTTLREELKWNDKGCAQLSMHHMDCVIPNDVSSTHGNYCFAKDVCCECYGGCPESPLNVSVHLKFDEPLKVEIDKPLKVVIEKKKKGD